MPAPVDSRKKRGFVWDRRFLDIGKCALVITLGNLFVNWTTGDVEFQVGFFLCALILAGILAWRQERDRAGPEAGAVVPVSFGVSRQGAVVLCVAGAVAVTLGGAVAVSRSLSAPDFEARGVTIVSRFAAGQPMVYGGESVKRVRIGESLAYKEPEPERSWDLQPVRHEGILHHRIVNVESRLCLDVEARLPRQSSHLTNSLCDEASDGQLWRLVDGTSQGRIASYGGELCIDIEQAVRDPGVALALRNCSGRCLRVEGESHEAGTELTLRACDRTDNHQQWRTPPWARYPDAPRT